MDRDNRELEGKTCIFTTTDSEWKKYSKCDCKVLKRVDETNYDFEDVGTMWAIQFSDGINIDAFCDELELKED